MIPAFAIVAETPKVPPLKAENLNGVMVKMPSEFEGEVNLLLIAFLQKQQADVDNLAKAACRHRQGPSKMRYNELPIIKRHEPYGALVYQQRHPQRDSR